MRFKLDENLPIELVEVLSSSGHEVETVPQQGLKGAPDRKVLEQARHAGEVLLTLDKNIANVRVYPPRDYAGVILLFRPPSCGRGAVLAFVRRSLTALLRYDLKGRLFVVSDRGVRIR